MFHWVIYACIFLTFFLTISAAPARLTLHHQNIIRNRKHVDKQSVSDVDDYKTYYYPQTLDHFNYNPQSYATFKQKYIINSKYWGGANSSAPIFAYLGLEAPLDVIEAANLGFFSDNAPSFKALMIYIEHRFYGESIPFGMPVEEAMKNESIRGYFNSAQAIADYAEVLLYTKRRLSALNSPIIVVGASYGGMLAAWFRLKYPHVSIGALASSAPILYFDTITPPDLGYYSIVSKDFKETSSSCYNIIKQSWSEIDRVAALPHGLSLLSKKFNTCRKLNDSSELKDFLNMMYCVGAQYNSPQAHQVSQFCDAANGAPKGSDLLGRVYSGLVALMEALYGQTVECINVDAPSSAPELIGWSWQTCSEMVMPIGVGSNDDSMFPASPFDINSFTKQCKREYGVAPRPHWVTTYYGGYDIKLVLQRFATNIIFSNGLKDPYSGGGVLEHISDTVHSIYTKEGSHCLDILPAMPDDPEWLILQRKREIAIIQGWLKEYYLNLYSVKGY